MELHLLAHKSPELVEVDDGVPVLVGALVEVTHTNLQKWDQGSNPSR